MSRDTEELLKESGARHEPKLAREARMRCEKWREYFNLNNTKYHYMNGFILGDQWTKEDRDIMMKDYNKNALTANKLGALRNTALGEVQQYTPQLQVDPVSNCTAEVAEIRALMVKDITLSGGFTLAGNKAIAQAATCGYGAILVDTDYDGKRSFNQVPKARYFKDATVTFFDRGAEEENKTDGMFCGYIQRITRAKFRQENGKRLEGEIGTTNTEIAATQEEVAVAVNPQTQTDPFNWSDGNSIVIIHYFKKKFDRQTTLYELSNGRTVTKEEYAEMVEDSKKRMQQQMMLPSPDNPYMSQEAPQEQSTAMVPYSQDMNMVPVYDGDELVRIEKEKPWTLYKIVHYKIAGEYVLDETVFPCCEHLPLIFVPYDSYFDKDGKEITKTRFDEVVDTQIYINYLRTQSAYILKCSRYDQWIGEKGNFKSLDTRQAWTDPFTVRGALTFDPVPSGVKPEQVRPPELSQSLFIQYELANQDLHTGTGIYEAQLGNNGDETSGESIDSRTRQGSYASDRLRKARDLMIETVGKIVNEMIPVLYDTERVLSLMTPEGRKQYTINKADPYGNIENDIRKGTYEVRLLPGPSYEGQKEEALRSLDRVLDRSPDKFDMIADLYAENLPLPNNIQIRNRLKTLVPPEVIEAGKTGQSVQPSGPSPEQQALQLQQQQMQQDAAMKAKELELKEKEIQLKEQEIIMEARAKLQALENQRLETAAELQEQELRYMAETERTQSNEQIAHADLLVKMLTHKSNQKTTTKKE